MTTVRSNTFETGTVGAAITTGFTGGGDAPSNLLGTPVFTSTAMHGTRALDCSASGAQSVFQWGSITSTLTFAYRFYFRRTSTPSATVQLIRANNATSEFHRLSLTTANKITVTHNGGTVKDTTTTTITQDVWYRIEAYGTIATTTTGALVWKLFAGDSTTPLETFTWSDANFGTTGLVSFWFGKIGTTPTAGLIFDDPIVTNTASAPGPASSPADLRTPSSVVSNPGSWTVLGGASDIPTGLSDSDDASGGQSPADPSAAAITLGFLDLTASKPVRVTGRHSSPAGSGNISRVYTLMQGATTIAARTYNPLPEDVTAFGFTTTTSETAAISDWSALRVKITDTLV